MILADLQLAMRNLEQAPDPSERVIRLLTSVERQARRQERLLGDLIDTACIDAGRLELHAGPGDLAAIVEDAVHDLGNYGPTAKSRAPSRRGPLRFPSRIFGSHRSCLINYLTNALKYSPGDQPVEVRLSVLDEAPEPRSGSGRLEVSDTVPALHADQARIWDWTLPSTRRKVLSGLELDWGWDCISVGRSSTGMAGESASIALAVKVPPSGLSYL